MSEKIVLVTDYTWSSTDPEAKVLAEVGADLLLAQTGSEEDLLSLVPRADAILTCFKKVSAAVIRAGQKLQVVGRYGIGVDNIAVDEATRLGIPVTNVPAYCLDEVAEHVMALLLACARQVCRYNGAVRDGNWSLQTGMPLFRVRGRTLGITGFGKIGQTLAAKARGFGLRILVYDPYVSHETVRMHDAERVDLEDLLAQADFVSLHTPLTPETFGLLNADRLRRMKSTAFVINTSRGAIIDHNALVQALREKWIAGAALDVFDPEPLPINHPLLRMPNVIATPHVAFYSEESVVELEVQAARNVAAILSGELPASVVNPEVLKLPRWAHLR
ncbi:MAG: C-terminal binding protein [Aggregatilineales bacterium]